MSAPSDTRQGRCRSETCRRRASAYWPTLYERKLDGVRCLVFRRGSGLRLLSRSRRRMNATWPELVERFAEQGCDDFVVDGEAVAFAGKRTSFARLQRRALDFGPTTKRATASPASREPLLSGAARWPTRG